MGLARNGLDQIRWIGLARRRRKNKIIDGLGRVDWIGWDKLGQYGLEKISWIGLDKMDWII
eukprot:2569258-Pyramimonas_sp.AAC.1